MGKRGFTMTYVCSKFWSAILVVLLIIGPFHGCGKKGPPVPPPRYRLPAVSDLTHRIDDQDLTLTWTVPDSKGSGKSAAEVCVVYRARQSVLEAECTGCPVPFVSVSDIPVVQDSTAPGQQNTLTYTETLLPGFSYTYKVVCFAPGGVPGENSNIVNFSF